MLTNVATLMTRTYTNNIDAFGCQLQGFLIQVFMQGDAYWALAMAINVYLTFYHKYDARALRKIEIIYFICCYGIPFIPGFTFLFVRNHAGRPYGNAVLWCWLRSEWEIYRIATFYGPVWVAIIIAMAIYIRAGRDIYKKRRKMLKFESKMGTGTAMSIPEGFTADSMFAPAFNYKTTEVVQTTEIIAKPSHPPLPGSSAPLRNPNVSFTVTISADNQARDSLDLEEADMGDETMDAGIEQGASQGTVNTSTGTITTVIHKTPAPLNNIQQTRRRIHEHNNATWSYAKCAILFFTVLLITWIPSSGNRVYSMVNHGAVSKPLFFASAFVLPLQGFWNAIIYIVTSWAACKSLWATVRFSASDLLSQGAAVISGQGMGPGGMELKDGIGIHHHPSRKRHSLEHVEGGVPHHHHGSRWLKGAKESTSMEDLTASAARLGTVPEGRSFAGGGSGRESSGSS